MPKRVIIAEKPVLGKAIADVLPGTRHEENGCITKGDTAVIWAYGHLLELKEPEDYDEKYAKWQLEDLPIYFEHWGQRPKQEKGRQGGASAIARLKQIAALLKDADCVVNAGDPDDEGQFLVDEIIRWCHFKGKVYRMDTGDTTAQALKKALDHLRDNAPLEQIGWSAYARSVADLIVGVNLSRFFSVKNQPVMLSIGRVQTPTLGLVVNRDLAIEGHTKTHYYTVTALVEIDGKQIPVPYVPAKDDPNLTDGKILDKAYAESKVEMIRALGTLSPIVISFKNIQEQPSLPFNLVELQSYASKKFGYDPADVMRITQELREKYRAITYNRSDCQYLSEEQYKEAGPTMQQVIANIGYEPKEMDMALHSRCFNDENITAHTAIIPTNQAVDLKKLTKEQRDVYLSICKYYMAQFMPPAEKGRTSLQHILPDGGKLQTTSTKILSPGYLTLFRNDLKNGEMEQEEQSLLSELEAGTYQGKVKGVSSEEKETKPPARYTMASLNKDMTRIAKYVKNPEVKELLLMKDKDKKGENGSIGTVATRADTIEKLVKRGYLELDGKKRLRSTPLGRAFYNILPEALTQPDMTARWWVIQEDIKNGNATPDTLTESVLEMVKDIIATEHPLIDQSLIPKHLIKGAAKESLGNCPCCGKPIIEGKNGYGCSGWKDGCKFTLWKKSKLPSLKNTRFTENDAKKLLSGGKVLKKNLVSKAGKKFEAYILLDPEKPCGNFGANLKIEFKKK